MKKLNKQEIYINLQGKTKEELTDLWEFLDNSGEKQYDTLEGFLATDTKVWKSYLFSWSNKWIHSGSNVRTEITIEQLKKII